MKPISILCFALTLLTLTLVAPRSAIAGKYADALSKCLAAKATGVERKTLSIWLFTVFAAHPSVSGLTKISPAQRTKINKDFAKVFENLITKTCKSEALQVLRLEGSVAFGNSFKALGEIAGRELLSVPETNQSLQEVDRFIDKNKLNSILK